MRGSKYPTRVLLLALACFFGAVFFAAGLPRDKQTAKKNADRKSAIVHAALQAGFNIQKSSIITENWSTPMKTRR